jgi:hypothetical protein
LRAASPAKTVSKRRPSGRYEAFISGEISVEDLDMEELLKGQVRDKNGSFTGRPPLMIPRAFHVKLTQELLHRAESKMRENFDDAMNVFVEIMNNKHVRAQDRLYAAQYVWERMAGKIPEKQLIEASVRKWEDAAEAVIVEIVGDDYEDAEIVDDEPPAMSVKWDDEEPLQIKSSREPASPRRPTRKAS